MYYIVCCVYVKNTDKMAQIRLTTNERLNVIEDVAEVQRRLTTLECIETGFVEFTQNVRLENMSMDKPDKIIQEPVFVNRAHVMMYY